jgi:O-antigen ligase
MTTRERHQGANSPNTARSRWLAFLDPQAVADPAWVNVWRWAVAVSLITSAVRSGGLATHIQLESAAWYALQFGPLAVATLATLRSGHLGGVPRWPARFLPLLVLCAAVSVVSASDLHQVLLQVALFAAAAVFLLSTYLLRWSDTHIREVDLRCVYWVFVGIHVVGLVGYVAGAPSFAGDFNRYLGVMSNANYAGMTAALALVLGASSKRAIDAVGAVPLALALWVSGSRGALLGLACAVVVIAVQRRWFTREWLARRRLDGRRLQDAWHSVRSVLTREGMARVVGAARQRIRRDGTGRKLGLAILLVAGVAVALIALSAVTAKDPAGVSGAVGNHFSGRQGGDVTSGRLELYRAMLDRWPEHPVFGSGYRTGVLNVQLSPTVTLPLQAHNVYLSVLVELGAIGLLAFGCLLLSVLLAGRWSHPLLAAVACALVLELTESAMFGFGGPSALLTWMVLLGFASTGAAGTARAPARDPARD